MNTFDKGNNSITDSITKALNESAKTNTSLQSMSGANNTGKSVNAMTMARGLKDRPVNENVANLFDAIHHAHDTITIDNLSSMRGNKVEECVSGAYASLLKMQREKEQKSMADTMNVPVNKPIPPYTVNEKKEIERNSVVNSRVNENSDNNITSGISSSNNIGINTVQAHDSIDELFYKKTLYVIMLETIKTLKDTKEYYNATNALFTLFMLGKLNEGLMQSIDTDDLEEIRGIVKEFKFILDSY